MSLLDALVQVDRTLLAGVVALRADALTPVMTLASEWWVKSLAIPAIGVGAELARRRFPPPTAPLAAIALGLATLGSSSLKELVDRARPSVSDPSVMVLIGLPGDASFPSGHATSAFAAAGVVAALHPRLAAPALGLAGVVGLSRVYLGVHHPADVVAGALLGLAIAAVVIAAARLVMSRLRSRQALSRPSRPARIARWGSTHST